MIRLVITIFLLPLLLFSKTLPLNLERMVVDFKGVCSNDKSIIVYGEAGIILRSSDRGLSWNQKQIDKGDLSINRIINSGSEYYGVLAKNRLVISHDDGLSWTNFTIDNNIDLCDLTLDKNFIYVLTNKKVFIFDYSLNKIDSVNFNEYSNAREIKIINGKLFITCDNSRFLIVDTKNDYEITKIDFIELGITNNYLTCKSIRYDKNTLYMLLGDYLLLSNNMGLSWKIFNSEISNYLLMYNKVFSIACRDSSVKNITFPDFFHVYEDRKIRINEDSIDRYINTTTYNALEEINKDTLICVGNDKTIYLSYNGGKNWNLISNMKKNTTQGYFVSNKLAYFWGERGQIFKTNDGGNTFLPQYYKSYFPKRFIYCNLMYFDSTGYGYAYANVRYNNPYIFLITNDFGNTYDTLNIKELSYMSLDPERRMIATDSTVLFFFPILKPQKQLTRIIALDKHNLRFKYMNDFENLKFSIVRFNSDKDAIEAFVIESQYPRFDSSKGTQVWDSVKYQILNSSDYGRSWLLKLSRKVTKEMINNCQFFDHKYIFKQSNYVDVQLYDFFIDIIDPLTFEVKPDIFIGRNMFGSFFNIGSSNYFANGSQTFSDVDIENSYKNWPPVTFSGYRLWSGLFSDSNFAFVEADDGGSNFYLLKATMNIVNSVQESEKPNTCVFTYPPFPIPAQDEVSSLIYWDMSSDIETDEISVFDVEGNKAEGKENITIDRVNSYSGHLRWDCSGVPNGIYLIKIKHGTTTKCIKVIVER